MLWIVTFNLESAPTLSFLSTSSTADSRFKLKILVFWERLRHLAGFQFVKVSLDPWIPRSSRGMTDSKQLMMTDGKQLVMTDSKQLVNLMLTRRWERLQNHFYNLLSYSKFVIASEAIVISPKFLTARSVRAYL